MVDEYKPASSICSLNAKHIIKKMEEGSAET